MNTHVKNFVVNIKVMGNNPHSSSGFIFNCAESDKSLIITSKHSLCSEKVICQKTSLDPSENKCRRCEAPIDPGIIGVTRLDKKPINIGHVIASSISDIALVELQENFNAHEIQLGSLDGTNEHYHSYDGKGDFIVFNSPSVPDRGYVSLNILSNTTANLEEKSESLKGRSGSPIFRIDEDKRYELVGIVTDEEKVNSIGAECLDDKVIDEFERSVHIKIFSKRSLFYANVDTKFITEKFELIKKIKFKGTNILVYCPKYSTEFDYLDIAKYLVERLYHTLATPKEITSTNGPRAEFFKTANKFIKDESNLISKVSLLQAVIESSLVAPKVFSQFSNDAEYHSIHLKALSNSNFEFIFTKFYSGCRIEDCVVNGLNEISQLDISSIMKSSLFSEHFLNSQLSDEHAELLSNILLPGGKSDYATSIATMLTWIPQINPDIHSLQFYKERYLKLVEELITEIELQLKNIENNVNPIKNIGTSLYMFFIPINRQGELKELMKEALKDE